MGVGTTLDACAELGRLGIGVELSEEFADVARGDLKQTRSLGQRVIVGDACKLTSYVEGSSVDFLLTSPPYGSLLKNVKHAFAYKWQEHSHIGAIPNPRPYSDRPEDLGNLEYHEYLERLGVCLAETRVVLRRDAYAVWVMKDFRALKEGVPFVNLHGHFMDLAERVGFTLWDIRVFDQTKYRPLVCLGYPSRNFYLNVGHSYLIVIRNR